MPPLAMYHWRVVTISSGLSPFSKNLTGCVMGFGLALHHARLAEHLDDALLGGEDRLAGEFGVRGEAGLGVDAPRGLREEPAIPAEHGRVGNWSSRHQITSVTSPNVQIIAMPEPLSGLARRWATTGTSTPNSGVRTCLPKSGW